MSADILAKFTIKEDKDIGGWVARCASMPNTVIHGREISDILRQIDAELQKAFSDASNIQGEITSLNAEYYIARREEVPLSAFQDEEEKVKESIAELKKDGVTIQLDGVKSNDPQAVSFANRVAELLDDEDKYTWNRITELKAGCAICRGLLNGCQGNKAGEPCNSYDARDNCEERCQGCTRYDKDKKRCRKHKAKVEPHDYCCHEYNGRNQ